MADLICPDQPALFRRSQARNPVGDSRPMCSLTLAKPHERDWYRKMGWRSLNRDGSHRQGEVTLLHGAEFFSGRSRRAPSNPQPICNRGGYLSVLTRWWAMANMASSRRVETPVLSK